MTVIRCPQTDDGKCNLRAAVVNTTTTLVSIIIKSGYHQRVGGHRQAPAAVLLGKTQYPLYRRLSGSQGRSGRVWKISPLPEFDPRSVQPAASRYTDYGPPTTNVNTNTSTVYRPFAIWTFLYTKYHTRIRT